jgi:hypothetical protein
MPSKPRRCNAPSQLRRHDLAPVGPSVQYRLHLRRVPRHHDVGQQAQGVGHCLHLVGTPGLGRPNTAGVNGALECVHRLAPVKNPAQLPAEAGIDEVVRQEGRPEQLAQLHTGVVDRVSLAAAEPNLASAVTALA